MTPQRRRSRPATTLAVVATAIVVSLGAAPGAHADPARARKHFEIGKRYFQVDEYRKAIEEFKAAHVEEPDPAFFYNIAECHRRLGETKEALVFYRRFLSQSPADAPLRATAEGRIAEIEGAPGTAAPPSTPAPPEAGGSRPVPAAPGAPGTSAGAPAAAPDAVPPPGASTPAPILTPTPTQAPEAAVSATPAETSRPFYRRGWFYGVVGAVLVAAAVSAWAISSSGGTEIPETPLGNQRVFEK